MGLAVQIVLDEEVASLLEVDAAVVAHETLGVVQLVPRLHDGAAGWTEAGDKAVISQLEQLYNQKKPQTAERI